MPKSQRAASRKGRGSLELFQTLTPLIFCQPSPGDSSSPQLHLLPAPSHLAVWKGLASPRRASPCSLLQASDRTRYTNQQHWGLCRAAQLPGSALVGPGWSLPSTRPPSIPGAAAGSLLAAQQRNGVGFKSPRPLIIISAVIWTLPNSSPSVPENLNPI